MLDAKAFLHSPTESDVDFYPVPSQVRAHGTGKLSTLPLTANPDCSQSRRRQLSKNGKRSVRVNLKGIHKVKKALADGTVATYFYAWRGGPKIDALPGSEGFVQAYTDAIATRKKSARGTVLQLTGEFRTSSEFTGKSKHTRDAYLRYVKLIEAKFGDMPLAALEDPEVRGEFKTWRDSMAANPRKADYAWTVLARVFSVAKDRGRIPVNPCEKGGRLYTANRTEKLWTDETIARFERFASAPLRLALTLALWTGQRQGDILRMRWSDYDGETIKIVQSKTGAAVAIRVIDPLRTLLAETKKRGPFICTNTRGKPWTSDGFKTSWGKACKRAGVDEVTFHDLRGTAITRLAMAGATSHEISGVTGHGIADVDAMLDRHYLGERAALGDRAMHKLAVYKTPVSD
jgi:integrase